MSRTRLLVFMLLVAGCRAPEAMGPTVRVTLGDGQVLIGTLGTKSVALETGFGALAFDSKDAGELGLLDGEDRKGANPKVRLWLRNGSEFVGRWQRPAVQVFLEVGERSFAIDVPIPKLARLQFKGEAVWADRPVFRIVTHHGDDFFVDVTKTRLNFHTEFGDFSPFLAEIEQLEPKDDKNETWQVRLRNGSVLKAKITDEVLDLTLAMGPPTLKLPRKSIALMDRQALAPQGEASGGQEASSLKSDAPFSRGVLMLGERAPSEGGRAAESGGFYSNTYQKLSKEQAAQSSQSWQSYQQRQQPKK